MKVNEFTALSSANLLFVPYETLHVPTYHMWMTDPDLQAATASEEQTLEEQFANQESWREDRDKLTFIICLRPENSPNTRGRSIVRGQDDGPERMIGDINLYLNPCVEYADEINTEAQEDPTTYVRAEIGLMIASSIHQGRGYGRTALLAFLSHVLASWDAICAEYSMRQVADCNAKLAYFFVKIHHNNHHSLRFFQGMGFLRTSETPNVFNELELQLKVSGSTVTDLTTIAGWHEVNALMYVRK